MYVKSFKAFHALLLELLQEKRCLNKVCWKRAHYISQTSLLVQYNIGLMPITLLSFIITLYHQAMLARYDLYPPMCRCLSQGRCSLTRSKSSKHTRRPGSTMCSRPVQMLQVFKSNHWNKVSSSYCISQIWSIGTGFLTMYLTWIFPENLSAECRV